MSNLVDNLNVLFILRVLFTDFVMLVRIWSILSIYIFTVQTVTATISIQIDMLLLYIRSQYWHVQHKQSEAFLISSSLHKHKHQFDVHLKTLVDTKQELILLL